MNNIKIVQKFLNIPVTGVLDELTQAALRNFQLKNGLTTTGLLDMETKEKLGIGAGELLDTDQLTEIPIKKYFLPKGEFLPGPTKKESLFLHHTAGYNNPFAVVDMWAKDPQGPIGTQYVIGGPHPISGDKQHDGTIVQCFDDVNYAWHLTIGNTEVHRNSVGIELCNFGWVTKGGYTNLKTKKWVPMNSNYYYTYTGMKLQTTQVVDLGFEFKGFRYYHRYSDSQLESLRFLIKIIGERHGINIYSGIINWLKEGMDPRGAFGYRSDVRHGRIKGMFCHSTVVEFGKWDLSPQPKLIEMLLSL
jgi:hypothetical protein